MSEVANNYYFCPDGKVVLGPFGLRQMRDLIIKGELDVQAQIFLSSLNLWQSLNEYPELQETYDDYFIQETIEEFEASQGIVRPPDPAPTEPALVKVSLEQPSSQPETSHKTFRVRGASLLSVGDGGEAAAAIAEKAHDLAEHEIKEGGVKKEERTKSMNWSTFALITAIVEVCIFILAIYTYRVDAKRHIKAKQKADAEQIASEENNADGTPKVHKLKEEPHLTPPEDLTSLHGDPNEDAVRHLLRSP